MTGNGIGIFNVTCTLANTEYSQALSANTKSFTIKARTFSDLKISFVSGESSTTYWSIPAGSSDTQYAQAKSFSGAVTVYFQSPNAGTVVEIIEKL